MFFNTLYITELITVTTIAIFMVISPGADFAMVTKNSILISRKAGLLSALGISIAVWIHVTYSIAGLALIISKSVILFSVLKYLGALYLIYIGWQTISSKSMTSCTKKDVKIEYSNLAAVKTGFITNALNPKTSVFFLSIFTQVVNQSTPLWLQIIYGAIISIAHLLWFSFVAVFLTHPPLLKKFTNNKRYIEIIVGCILIIFGLKIAFAPIN